MSNFSRWSSRSTVLLVLGIAANSVAPLIISVPASAASLSDVSGHWARPFIEKLADQNIIAGFPDGTFKPDQPVTRAQFAAIIRQAFNQNQVREYRGFRDIPTSYWATPAIEEAYEAGFMSGYPGGLFEPNQEIPKVQVLVSLASGLRLSPSGSTSTTLGIFSDASDVPDYAVNGVAAATEKRIVVNYPNVRFLNPNETATRGDVAAFIYQALVNERRLQPIASGSSADQYIVRGTAAGGNTGNPGNTGGTGLLVSRGTTINVRYPGSNNGKIILAPGETVPATLQFANRTVDASGQVVIPANSQIQGRFVPLNIGSTFGTQFVADRLIIGNQSYTINATSNTVAASRRQTIEPGMIQGGVATVAAQTILGRLLGNQVNLSNLLSGVLSGGSIGADSTNRNSVIVIDPQNLQLTFNSDLYAGTGNQSGGSVNTGNENAGFLVTRGTLIDVKYPGSNNVKVIVAPGETIATTLQITNDITNSRDEVVIPANSRIQGRFVPVSIGSTPGTQFVADRLLIGSQSYTINATSNPIIASSSQTINPGSVQGGIASTAAQAILGQILGNQANLGNILSGVLGGGSANTTSNQNSVIVVNPSTDLRLTLNSDLYVNSVF